MVAEVELVRVPQTESQCAVAPEVPTVAGRYAGLHVG